MTFVVFPVHQLAAEEVIEYPIFDYLKKQFHIVFCLFIALCISPFVTQSQIPKNQFEIVLTGDEIVESTACIENYVLISSVKAAVKSKYIPTRRYILLDSILKVQIDTIPPIPFRHKPRDQYRTNDAFYDFYYDYRRGEYSLVESSKSEFQVVSGDLPNMMYEPQIVVGDEAKFFLDRRINRERIVVAPTEAPGYESYSVKRVKKRTKVFPLYFDFIQGGTDVSYIWREKSSKENDVFVATWSGTGESFGRFQFSIPDKTIHGITIYQLSEDRILLTGTYAKYTTRQASGVFFAVIEDGCCLNMKTFSFSDLPHYFDYLDKYEKLEMKRKLARLKKHEKSTEIRTHAFAHPVISIGNGFMLPVEIYKELYTDLYGVTRNGNTIAGSPQDFKGYAYSHGLILRFDAEGQLKHDYYFDIDLDYIPWTTSAKLQTFVDDDTLQLGYAAKNKLYFGHIKPLEFGELNSDTIPGKNSTKVTRKEAQFFYMNDGSALIYGYRTQKQKQGFLKKADVYFIEKRKVR